MKNFLIGLLFIAFQGSAQSAASNGMRGGLAVTATYNSGFKVTLTWNQYGTFELQRALKADYSDATTIYTGILNTYQDTQSVLNGICFYRVRNTSTINRWVYAQVTSSNSDGTTGTITCFFGDSVTQGVGTTTAATDAYSRVFHTLKSWTNPAATNDGIINEIIGLGGYGITPGITPPNWVYSSGTNQMAAKTTARNYCIMAFGINDTQGTTSAYQTAVSNWIDYAVSVGWPLNRIIIFGPFNCVPPSGINVIPFRNAIELTATSKGVAFLSPADFQIASGMTTIGTDGIHPNTAQALAIATWFASHLENNGL